MSSLRNSVSSRSLPTARGVIPRQGLVEALQNKIASKENLKDGKSGKHHPQPLYQLSWSRKYEPGFSAKHIMENKDHALHIPMQERYARRPKEGLWWYVNPNGMKMKKVMRTAATWKMKAAIRRGLESQGYDVNGLPRREVLDMSDLEAREAGGIRDASNDKPKVEGTRERGLEAKMPQALLGTLTVMCQPPILLASNEEISEAGVTIVEKAIRLSNGKKSK
ncbi:hypothetical protein MMC25_003976 [Agyrium rufum]|nr:hypothetical protein [Agyrium rufum]